jgi:hypothetical protein
MVLEPEIVAHVLTAEEQEFLKLFRTAKTRHPNYLAAMETALGFGVQRMQEYAGDQTEDPFANFRLRAELMAVIEKYLPPVDPKAEDAEFQYLLRVFMSDILLKYSRLIANTKDGNLHRIWDSMVDGGNYFELGAGSVREEAAKRGLDITTW